MPLYRLKAGQTHYARVKSKQARKGLRKMEVGEEIELSPPQFHALRDKFELVGDTKVEKAATESLKKDVEEAAFEVVEDKKVGGRYNVRNKVTKEFLNDEPLTKIEAELLAKS